MGTRRCKRCLLELPESEFDTHHKDKTLRSTCRKCRTPSTDKTTKTCHVCRSELSMTRFAINRTSSDGHQDMCKMCRSRYYQSKKDKNKDVQIDITG